MTDKEILLNALLRRYDWTAKNKRFPYGFYNYFIHAYLIEENYRKPKMAFLIIKEKILLLDSSYSSVVNKLNFRSFYGALQNIQKAKIKNSDDFV